MLRRLRDRGRVNDDGASAPTRNGTERDAERARGLREETGNEGAAGGGDCEEQGRDHALRSSHAFNLPRSGIRSTLFRRRSEM
jgi:hypothetical protein